MSAPARLDEASAHAELRLRAKIIPRIVGGIGNQLFSYAAARRLALVNHAVLVLDDVSGFAHDYVYQRGYQLDHFTIPCRKATPAERLEPLSRVRRYLKRAMNRRRPFEERSYIQQEGIDFDPRLMDIKPRGTVYLEGYWQSEQYFKDVEAVIREDLRITPPTDEINQSMVERIRNCRAVAVHVRFFDAPQEQGANNVPSDYYVRAIARMETLAPDAHYFVFSDQPAGARAKIPLPEDRITLVSHNQGDENAYADLWLMTQCQHFIIANSTFSWWGAWLAGYADKQVIAPGVRDAGGKDGVVVEVAPFV
ncbi:MAG: alpha-1,2-fucosyltransferase [Ilumatobacteraceae bacterium]